MAVFIPSLQARPILADARRELGGSVSPYANFLVGYVAMKQGDIGTASRAMGDVSDSDPLDTDVNQKAYIFAFLNGDIDRALAMSSRIDAAGAGKPMAPLLNTVAAVKTGKPAAALAGLDAILKADPKDRVAVMLRPYALAMNGQWRAAIDPTAIADNKDDRAVAYLLQAERAHILELHNQPKAAEEVYKALQGEEIGPFFAPDYARFLERRGRKDEARAMWKQIADSTGSALAIQALKQLDAPNYVKPAVPDLRQGVAQALYYAAYISYGQRDPGSALVMLRLSMYLDETSDRSRVFLGQVDKAMGYQSGAEGAWSQVATASPYYSEAALYLISSLRERKDNDGALALAEQGLARDPDNLALTVEKAGILADRGDNAAALRLFDDRIARAGDKDFTWQAWFLCAMIHDNMDQWSDAETAINKARSLAGDRPEILNFIGYGWINRGLHVKEGMDLVRQAMAVNPKSGAVIDSLGWGYYKLGDYEQALVYVEQAVQLAPSDAEINEHLGDVYKALGRDTEAGYEWQRVLTLEVSDKVAADVRQKLDAISASAKIAAQPAKAPTTALADGKASGGQN